PAEPAEQLARARRGHPHHSPGAAIQQAGPAARADPFAGGSGRRPELPQRAELQRGRAPWQGCVRDAQRDLGAGAQEARGGDRGMTSALNPKYSFDTFVVGAANRLAVTAGHTVAESPGAAYNPLFIYSGSGLGKTHLLMAVGHAAKKAAPKLNIEYLTLDEYVEAFHASVAAAQGRRARRAVRAGRAGDRGAGGGRQRARADGRAEPARGVPGGQRHIHQRGDGEADSRACRRGGGGHPAGRWARRRGKERGRR